MKHSSSELEETEHLLCQSVLTHNKATLLLTISSIYYLSYFCNKCITIYISKCWPIIYWHQYISCISNSFCMVIFGHLSHLLLQPHPPALHHSLSVSEYSDTLALLTHMLSFMRVLTQVEPCSDSSLELVWCRKQVRLAGLCSDTGFSLQGEVTVIGVPFKA